MHSDGKLIGMICIHVDDVLILGNKTFARNLFNTFKISKVEKDKFKYHGCKIEKVGNGDIMLNQMNSFKILRKFNYQTKRTHANYEMKSEEWLALSYGCI